MPAAGVTEPTHGSCHHRRPLTCDFDRPKQGGCHRIGTRPVTSSTRSRVGVTGSGIPSGCPATWCPVREAAGSRLLPASAIPGAAWSEVPAGCVPPIDQ